MLYEVITLRHVPRVAGGLVAAGARPDRSQPRVEVVPGAFEPQLIRSALRLVHASRPFYDHAGRDARRGRAPVWARADDSPFPT